jgi:threonine 3-dehydrogenase
MAQYAVIPAKNAIKISSKIHPEIACFMDAYGNAVDTCLTLPLTGKVVLITGCGPQGLMAIAIALASGAKKIIATEVAPRRMMKAREIFRIHGSEPNFPEFINNPSHPKIKSDSEYSQFLEGLSYLDDPSDPNYPGKPNLQRDDTILDATDRNMLNKIYLATEGLGVDVLLEMTGNPTALRDGVSSLRAGGAAVILGLASDKVELDWNELVFKAITVYFRYGRKLYETWMYGQRFLESGEVKLQSLVHKPFYRFDDIGKIHEAYKLQIDGKVAKAVFTPNSN